MEQKEIYYEDKDIGMYIDEDGKTHFKEVLNESQVNNGIELHKAFELMKTAIAEYQKKKYGHTL